MTASQIEAGAGAAQAELFGDAAVARDRQLDRVVDRVNERFGPVMRRGAPRRREPAAED